MRTFSVSNKVGAIAAVLLAASFALAACGGGGGLNEDEAAGIRDELKAAQAAQAAAEAEQAAAEAEAAAAQTAQAAAEADAAAALTAQRTAEAQAAAARTAQEAAETAARAAEAAQQLAEANAAAALAAQTAAEADAAAALAAQRTAEAEAAQALADKNAADAARAAAEAKAIADVIKARDAAAEDVAAALEQVALAEQAEQAALDAKAAADTALAQARADESDAEDARDAARTAQMDAEAERDRARMAEQAALNEKAMAETRQQEAEDARDVALAAQKTAEDARDDALAAKQEAERLLQEARQQLSLAEQQRLAAEQEAQRQIEQARQEAEQQANVTVRAPLLITLFSANLTEAPNASVGHMPGEQRTFTRPNDIPAEGSAPSVPGSWASASYSGPRGAVGTDTVYLYTNIQAPSKRRFWKVYGKDEAVSGGNISMARTTGSRIVRVTNTNDTPAIDDDTITVTYGGTFDGASGTFSCDGGDGAGRAGCVLTNAATVADGLTIENGTWTFTPSSVNNLVGSTLEDRAYLYFGIWAFEPTNPADGDNPHAFSWAGGGDAADITNFDALTGSATFTGGAVGKYALAKVGGREAKIGTFTATATFTANFDNAPDGSAGNSLSGRITDLKDGGSDLGSDWNVFLGGSASQAATLAAGGVEATDGVSSGAIDGDSATGVWAATLHGSDNADMSNAADYTTAKYPRADVAGVAGWFRANAGSNAAIAGAFGAACTTGAMCAR